MKKSYLELLIVALMAVPIGAHGLSAMVTHRLWVSPRFSRSYEMVGTGADLMGLAWLAMAACIFSVWFAIRSSHRRLGLVLVALFAVAAAGAFAGALFMH